MDAALHSLSFNRTSISTHIPPPSYTHMIYPPHRQGPRRAQRGGHALDRQRLRAQEVHGQEVRHGACVGIFELFDTGSDGCGCGRVCACVFVTGGDSWAGRICTLHGTVALVNNIREEGWLYLCECMCALGFPPCHTFRGLPLFSLTIPPPNPLANINRGNTTPSLPAFQGTGSSMFMRVHTSCSLSLCVRVLAPYTSVSLIG